MSELAELDYACQYSAPVSILAIYNVHFATLHSLENTPLIPSGIRSNHTTASELKSDIFYEQNSTSARALHFLGHYFVITAQL